MSRSDRDADDHFAFLDAAADRLVQEHDERVYGHAAERRAAVLELSEVDAIRSLLAFTRASQAAAEQGDLHTSVAYHRLAMDLVGQDDAVGEFFEGAVAAAGEPDLPDVIAYMFGRMPPEGGPK